VNLRGRGRGRGIDIIEKREVIIQIEKNVFVYDNEPTENVLNWRAIFNVKRSVLNTRSSLCEYKINKECVRKANFQYYLQF